MADSTAMAHLALFVRRRRTELELSGSAAAKRAGVSIATWTNVEGEKSWPKPVTAAKICKCLDWTADSIDRVLTGGEPVLIDTSPAPTNERDPWTRDLEKAASDLELAAGEIRSAIETLRRSPSPNR